MIKTEIRLRCIDDMNIFKPYGGMMRGEKFLGKFLEGEEYTGTLDTEKMKYMVKSNVGQCVHPAYIDEGKLIVEDGWELIE